LNTLVNLESASPGFDGQFSVGVNSQGLASEAARCMAAFAFDRFPIEELLAVRHPDNVDSGRVMDRLGMRQRGLESWYGTTVATHVISRGEWQRNLAAENEA
jgi:RimJ/RimL family protein N-acetyltransferase